ncbi:MULTISPECIES: ABC transporter permease [Actinoplanes]|uniref:ABC transporter permease n=1 Tax=Actinoplanes TaxID=1865 RepID=UPI0005F2B0E8|nr:MULTISPECIES: ABC transporter permease [Actinoplanes]GLY03518.1 hypothetical protein Acsp01_38970 [Actinoplanes sp. NBRC 101535]
MNLVRAELLKIRTTSLWWIFGIVLLPLWALSLAFNWFQYRGSSPAGGDIVDDAATPVAVASDLYTTGQFFGILMVLLIGAILMTNEFFHLTATSTFLTSPRRGQVILAKYAAAAIAGAVVWVVLTALNLILVPLLLDAMELGSQLDETAVWRAIALNLLAFLLWAVLGVGCGVLLRSQMAAALTLSLLYVIGTQAITLVFFLLTQNVAEWIGNLQVLVPVTASQLMISGTDLPGSPPQWVGAVVLIGYAVVTGLVGTLITKSRDIS